MSDVLNGIERLRTVDLGRVTPARSRHAGRRSAVELVDELVVIGTAAGDVLAHDRATLDERWRTETETEQTAVVAAAAFGNDVGVGERGPKGAVRCYDANTGDLRWRYATASDVGSPQKPSRFFLPFVVDVTADSDHLYVASRRYERDGERRSFTSVIYAFDKRGDIVWTYGTDASPISIDVDGRRLGVAYNRCPGTHQHGLVVLDSESGSVRYRWDPGTDGQRRIGDLSLVEGGVVVASHGDYRGYCLDDTGAEQWRVDLATPTAVDGETLYAYPNHVHATTNGVVFVTGNTYSTNGHETESLHPCEHTAFGYTTDGERVWSTSVGGFTSELGIEGDHVAVPGAQHFRMRDGDLHGLRLIETERGVETSLETEGVVAAIVLDGDGFAAVEEPVVYHDDGTERGSYRLLLEAAASG